MGKIIDEIFSWSVEDLRNEFCIEIGYELMRVRVAQIKDKFKEIEEMMDKQLIYHKVWDKGNTKLGERQITIVSGCQ